MIGGDDVYFIVMEVQLEVYWRKIELEGCGILDFFFFYLIKYILRIII